MPYASLALLTERYGERMLVEATAHAATVPGEIAADLVERALADADATVDGYLAARYALPLASVPPQVAVLAQEIAIYKLHRFTPEDKIKTEYEAAIATLRDIAKGVVRLPVAGIEPETSGSEGVMVTDRARPFTEDNLRGFL